MAFHKWMLPRFVPAKLRRRIGNISSQESGAELLRPLPPYLFDRSLMTMPQIRIPARAMKYKGCCETVITDYLQLIDTPPEERRYGNREREVAEISRAAKLPAKELDIPVILQAQLSRKIEERVDKTPLLCFPTRVSRTQSNRMPIW